VDHAPPTGPPCRLWCLVGAVQLPKRTSPTCHDGGCLPLEAQPSTSAQSPCSDQNPREAEPHETRPGAAAFETTHQSALMASPPGSARFLVGGSSCLRPSPQIHDVTSSTQLLRARGRPLRVPLPAPGSIAPRPGMDNLQKRATEIGSVFAVTGSRAAARDWLDVQRPFHFAMTRRGATRVKNAARGPPCRAGRKIRWP
jgi:hypothetical protein